MLQIFSFFILTIIWSSLKLFLHIHGYLFIFAINEIYLHETWQLVNSLKCLFPWFVKLISQNIPRLGFSKMWSAFCAFNISRDIKNFVQISTNFVLFHKIAIWMKWHTPHSGIGGIRKILLFWFNNHSC